MRHMGGEHYAQSNRQRPGGRGKAAGHPVLRWAEERHRRDGAGGLREQNLREVRPRPDEGVH